MATSRTGTAAHKRFRARVLQRDEAAGITSCPLCGTQMDYQRSRLPNSAEPDHILPYTKGGTHCTDNGRAICRSCNQSRGNGTAVKMKTKKRSAPTISGLTDW